MSDLMTPKNQITANAVKSRVGKRIRVLLADDHTIVRQGLSSLLQCETDFEVVGEAENGWSAIDLARQCSPDVVIIDSNLPVMNGIEATHILTEEMPRIKVIALSMNLEANAITWIHDAGSDGLSEQRLPYGGISDNHLCLPYKGARLYR
jgi:CheY-like chemotaxis protein